MIVSLLACSAVEPLPPVAMTGTVAESRGSTTPVPEATVSTVALDGTPVDTVTADAEGTFVAMVPAGASFYTTVDADDAVPTVFAGLAPTSDFDVAPGAFWLRSEQDLADLRAAFHACPTANQGGSVVEGEVRLYLPTDDHPDTLPLVTTATVTAYTRDGVAFAACYLADDGTSSADATTTGETGKFAIFGIPAGPTTLQVVYTIDETAGPTAEYGYQIPQDAVVPQYPMYAPVP